AVPARHRRRRREGRADLPPGRAAVLRAGKGGHVVRRARDGGRAAKSEGGWRARRGAIRRSAPAPSALATSARLRERFHDAARNEKLDEIRVELGTGLAAQDLFAFVHRDRLLVRAIGGHRVVCVAEADDAGEQRDVLALELVGIARAIPALVMISDA